MKCEGVWGRSPPVRKWGSGRRRANLPEKSGCAYILDSYLIEPTETKRNSEHEALHKEHKSHLEDAVSQIHYIMDHHVRLCESYSSIIVLAPSLLLDSLEPTPLIAECCPCTWIGFASQ